MYVMKCTFVRNLMKKFPDTFQKMTKKIIDEIHDQLLEIHFEVQSLYVAMANHYCIKISHI